MKITTFLLSLILFVSTYYLLLVDDIDKELSVVTAVSIIQCSSFILMLIANNRVFFKEEKRSWIPNWRLGILFFMMSYLFIDKGYLTFKPETCILN